MSLDAIVHALAESNGEELAIPTCGVVPDDSGSHISPLATGHFAKAR